MSTRQWLIGLLGLAAAAWLDAGCGGVECADGTHEQDGLCVPSDVHTEDSDCGPLTHLEGGMCIVDDPTVCDPATTTPVFDPLTGVTTCVGVGGGCDQALTCLGTTTGKNKICGRLYDVASDAQIRATDAVGLPCGEDGAGVDGPCLMIPLVYDALDFASGGTDTLAVGTPLVDDCGRFVMTDVEPAQTGFTGIGFDDHPSAPDVYRTSGVAFATAPNGGTVVNNVKVYMITGATDDDWSTDIGFTSGGTMVDRGAMMVRYHYPGNTPDTGVQMSLAGGADTSHDYYFTDVDPNTRTTLSNSANTGANGLGIFTDIGLGIFQVSGTGGSIPGTCDWESNQAAAPPGVFFYTERKALEGTSDCP